MDEFTKGYMECIIFTECHADNPELKDCDSFSDSFLQKIVADCQSFQEENKELLDLAYQQVNYDAAYAGHDFWLTRNRHGAGFWDRSQLDAVESLGKILLGKKLTEAAHAYGEVNVYADANSQMDAM